MSELDAILAAVLREPAEDIHRLAYADALDEAGGKQNCARARLIRVTTRWERELGPHWFRLPLSLQTGKDAEWVVKMLRRNWRDFVRTPPPTVPDRRQKRVYPGGSGSTPVLTWESFQRELHEYAESLPRTLGVYIYDYNSTVHPPPNHVPHCYRYFSRGFYSRVKCHWPHWQMFGDTYVKHEPIVEVELTTTPDVGLPFSSVAEAADSPREGDILNGCRGDYLRARWPTVATWTLPPSP